MKAQTQTTGFSSNLRLFLVIVGAIVAGGIILFVAKDAWNSHQASVAREKAEMAVAEEARQVQESEQLADMKVQYQDQLDSLELTKEQLEYLQDGYNSADRLRWCEENQMPLGLKPSLNPTPQECANRIVSFVELDNGIADWAIKYNAEYLLVPTKLLESENLPQYGYMLGDDGNWYPAQ